MPWFARYFLEFAQLCGAFNIAIQFLLCDTNAWSGSRGKFRSRKKVRTMLPIGGHVRRWNGSARWTNCAPFTSKAMLLLQNKDFREFIALLNSHEVKFLIVGGHAVTFHGYPRYTGDLDIWVAIDPANALRVEKVLKDFGFGSIFSEADFSKAGYAIQLGRPPYRIDILTSIDGADFESAYPLRKLVHADGVELPFIGLDHLLANKRAAGRPQDLLDVSKLETAPSQPKTSTRRLR